MMEIRFSSYEELIAFYNTTDIPYCESVTIEIKSGPESGVLHGSVISRHDNFDHAIEKGMDRFPLLPNQYLVVKFGS